MPHVTRQKLAFRIPAARSTFSLFLLFIFSLFFYFDRPPHRDLSLSSLKLPLLSDGREEEKEKEKRRRKREEPHALSFSNPQLPLLSDGKMKKKRRIIEEDFGSDFGVLFVDGFDSFENLTCDQIVESLFRPRFQIFLLRQSTIQIN